MKKNIILKTKTQNLKPQMGFTLIELLIYTAISVIVSGLAVGTLITVTKISQNQSATTEVSGQTNFVIQRLQQLVSESSNIDIDAGVATSSVKLRMQNAAKDPTCVYLASGTVRLAEGPDTSNPANCNLSAATDLTNSKVVASSLSFKKITQYPGHDTLSVDMTISYSATNPDSQVSRTLSSAIARVSAATFDSNLLPGSDNAYEVGYTGQRWKNISISNLLNVGQLANDPTSGMENGSIYYNTTSNDFRGYKNSAWTNINSWMSSSTTVYYNSGNVGIGTSTPAYKFSIQDTNAIIGKFVTNHTSGAQLMLSSTDTGGGNWRMISTGSGNSGGAGNFVLYNDISSYAFIIKSNGNVGIGTTAPQSKLDVKGATNIDPALVVTGGTFAAGKGVPVASLAFSQMNYVSGNRYLATIEAQGGNNTYADRGQLAFKIGYLTGGAPETKMTIDFDGNVGIGVTPTEKLQVNGNIVNSAITGGYYIGLTGDLPGYTVNNYPVLKTNFTYLYFSVAGAYSAYMNSAGTLTAVSDRNKKENFVEIDNNKILAKIDSMPMYQWNFKSEDPSIKHIAPVAQDFYAAFGLNGTSDKMISSIDPAGVALVGVKALSSKLSILEKNLEKFSTENKELKTLVCQDHPSAKVCQN
ncbi:MAG: tail fiber domain-containing protein [Candidatus Paceibacterota bacterium]